MKLLAIQNQKMQSGRPMSAKVSLTIEDELAIKKIQQQLEIKERLKRLEEHRSSNDSFMRKKNSKGGDPMTHFGIMTLSNHVLPYKKPVLKSMPVFVNAKGVI